MTASRVDTELVRELIEKYQKTGASLTEADVAEVFVAPLFAALGWDTLDPLVWNRQRYVRSGGYADAALQVQHRPVLFVEVKRFGRIVHPQEEVTIQRNLFGDEIILSQAERAAQGIDRTPEEKQAMRYARAAGIRWAVLTNFERLILFNADEERVVLAFDTPDEYLARPDDLALLAPTDTPEQFDSRLQWYADLQKKPEIDEDFYRFLSDWRIKLAQVIYEHNWKGETLPEIGERSYAHLPEPPLTAVQGKGAPPRHLLLAPDGSLDMDRLRQTVQRTLDRLILLRYADDVGFLGQHDLLESQLVAFMNRRVYTVEYEFQQDIDRLSHNFYRHHNTSIFAPGHVCERVRIPNDTLVDLVRAVSGISFRKFASDILGNTYESYLGQRLVLDGETIRAESDRRLLKSGGIYYTPSYIVRYIVDHTLGRWLYGTADGRPGASRKTLADLDGLRILDPAMGSGSFLIYAFEVLADFYESENARVRQENAARWDAWGQQAMKEGMFGQDNNVPEMGRTTPDYVSRILQEHLYGVDLDPEAAEIAGVNLILRAFDRLKGQHERRKLPLILGQNLKVGNSLIGGVTDSDDLLPFEDERRRLIALRRELAALEDDAARAEKMAQIEAVTAPVNDVLNVSLAEHFDDVPARRPFNWEIEFSEVFDPDLPEEERGFTIVVGNPPYGMMQPHNTSTSLLQALRNRYLSADFKADKFQMFTEQGIQLLANYGRLGFIVPNTLLTNVYAAGLRKYITDRCSIERIVISSQKLFASDVEVNNAIITLQREPETEIREHNQTLIVLEADQPFLVNESTSRAHTHWVEQAQMRDLDGDMWNVRVSNETAALVRHIETHSMALSEIARINRGLITGDRPRFFAKEILGEEYKPIISGSNVGRYTITFTDDYVLFKRGEKAGGCWDPQVHFHPNKIVIRQIGRYPIASLDTNPFCVTGNIFTIILTDPHYDPRFILALVNARLIRVLWDVLYRDFKSIFPEFKGVYLERLPIRAIDFTDSTDVAAHDRLVKLAQRMLDLNRVRKAVTGSFAEAIRAYERTFIPLHLFLNEQRDFITRHVLLDANDEGEVNGIGVEEQEGGLLIRAQVSRSATPTYWRDIVRLDIEDEDLRLYLLLTLRAFLHEKRRKRVWSRGKILNGVLKALKAPRLEAATPQAHQRRVAEVLTDVRHLLPPDLLHHDAGLDRHGAPLHLSDIEADLAATDAEIDRCVYDLYGLSEEERRIVEESLTT